MFVDCLAHYMGHDQRAFLLLVTSAPVYLFRSSSSAFERKEKGAAVEVTIERRQSSSYQMTTEYGSKATSRKGSQSGSRPGSRHGSRATSRGASPTPFDSQQQTTDEESELRRILEDSRGRRTKFNH